MRKSLVAACAAVSVSLTTALAVAPAEARSSAIAFNSNNLATYQANGIVWALATDGTKVFAGGSFTSIRPAGSAAGTNEQAASNLAVLDAATGNPTGCTINVVRSAAGATVRALNVSPDGKTLYVGGLFSSINGVAETNFAAVDIATCKPISTFKASTSGYVRGITSTATSVYVVGDFQSAGTTASTMTTRSRAAAFSPAGALQPWAPAADSPVLSVSATTDNRVVLGGGFNSMNGASSKDIAVVDGTTGANIRTFPNFYDATSVTKKVVVSGNAFYVANEGTGGGVFDGRTAVSLDNYAQIWRDTCLGATQTVLPYNGVLYSASHEHDCSSMGLQNNGRRQHLNAQTMTGPTKKLPWYPDTNDGLGEGIGPRDMVVSGTTSKYMWVAGEFTSVNGKAQQSLTRFGDGTDLAAPTIPALSLSSTTAGAVDVRWRPATDTDDQTLTYNLYKGTDTKTPYRTFTVDSTWWARKQQLFTDSGLTPGSAQTYRMSATDGTNTSPLSAPLTVTVASTTGVSRYVGTVLADKPGSLWRLDEAAGSFAADTTSAANSGQFSAATNTYGTPGAINGDSDTSVTLTGTASIANELPQSIPGDWSTEAWFKTTSTTGGRIIGWSNSALTVQAQADKQVYLANNGKLYLGWYNNRGWATTINSSRSYNDGQFHHVVATRSGRSGLRLYVDGSLVAYSTNTDQLNYTGFWRVGGDAVTSSWAAAPSAQFLSASIDEVATYNYALSSSQVLNHYRASGR